MGNYLWFNPKELFKTLDPFLKKLKGLKILEITYVLAEEGEIPTPRYLFFGATPSEIGEFPLFLSRTIGRFGLDNRRSSCSLR